MRREACRNGVARFGQVVRKAGHFGAVYPRVDEQHASPALHDNGVALAELALVDQHTFRDLSQHGFLPLEGIASNILADRLKRLVKSGLLTREDTRTGQRARYSLTEPAIQLVPVFAQLGSWGLHHRPTSSALNARAELLEQGGPALWQEFMDELRYSHVGSDISPRSPSVRERLNAAYLAAANSS